MPHSTSPEQGSQYHAVHNRGDIWWRFHRSLFPQRRVEEGLEAVPRQELIRTMARKSSPEQAGKDVTAELGRVTDLAQEYYDQTHQHWKDLRSILPLQNIVVLGPSLGLDVAMARKKYQPGNVYGIEKDPSIVEGAPVVEKAMRKHNLLSRRTRIMVEEGTEETPIRIPKQDVDSSETTLVMQYVGLEKTLAWHERAGGKLFEDTDIAHGVMPTRYTADKIHSGSVLEMISSHRPDIQTGIGLRLLEDPREDPLNPQARIARAVLQIDGSRIGAGKPVIQIPTRGMLETVVTIFPGEHGENASFQGWATLIKKGVRLTENEKHDIAVVNQGLHELYAGAGWDATAIAATPSYAQECSRNNPDGPQYQSAVLLSTGKSGVISSTLVPKILLRNKELFLRLAGEGKLGSFGAGEGKASPSRLLESIGRLMQDTSLSDKITVTTPPLISVWNFSDQEIFSRVRSLAKK